MARLVPIALFLAFVPAAAWSQSVQIRDFSASSDARSSRDGQFRLPSESQAESVLSNGQFFAGAEVAPNTLLGFGTFGMKRERSYQAPVTARDMKAQRSRRTGVGVRLKF